MENGPSLKQAVFLVVFAVVTLLCWCPIGYGAYGAPTLILGMPSWAVAALAIGAVMFVIELVYLIPDRGGDEGRRLGQYGPRGLFLDHGVCAFLCRHGQKRRFYAHHAIGS
ncbi:hypothetical protein [Desulfosarcina variabilis]|uniref:hypothetical protein n=1 Tax=Desulfosarcina variabilis TaxID=2300 RepID=UPI003AFADAD6